MGIDKRFPGGAVALAPEVEEIVERCAEAMRLDWDEQLGRLLVDWDPITQLQSQALQRQVRQLVEDNDVAALEDLTVPTEEAESLLAGYLLGMFQIGEDQIAVEEARQTDNRAQATWRVANAAVGEDRTTLIGVAVATTANLARGLVASVSKLVLRLWGALGPDAMSSEVREFINGLSDRALRDELGGSLTHAMNRGRFAALLRSNAATWYATERNDPNRCGPCGTIDETQFATLAAAMAAYPTGGFRDCEGGVRCRGGVVPVWDQ